MTADGSPVVEKRPTVRRSLISVFGEPIGSVSFDGAGGELVRRHRQNGQAPLDQGRAAGCREEIQITLLGHPVDIAERVVSESRLEELQRLGLSASSPRGRNLGTKHREIAWDAVVRTIPWRRRRATLRLFGSPSSNVTVLTLTPRRQHRLGVRSFLGVGMRALEHLRDDLEALPPSGDLTTVGTGASVASSA